MKNVKRLLTGIVFIPLFYLMVRHLVPAVFFIFIEAAVLLCCIEYYRLTVKAGYKPEAAVGTLLAMATCYSVAGSDYGLDILPYLDTAFLLVVSIFILPVSYLIKRKAVEKGTGSVGLSFLGVLLFGFLLGYQPMLRNADDGPELIFFLYMVVWVGDTAAFYTGSRLGKHKLSPRISPNKTIEGAAGSFVFALAAAVGARYWFAGFMTITDALIIGAVINITAQFGDLTFSLFKRDADIKDSSGILPGHGGLLDRADSLVFGAPFLFYFYSYLIR